MSQFNTPSYDIQRPTGVCAFTGRELLPGESYYATLVELSDEEMAEALEAARKNAKGGKVDTSDAALALGLKRLDVSAEAWEGSGRPQRLFSHWKSTVSEPNAKPKMFVDDSVLMNLLRRLAEATETQRLAFRYVLMLILMRKKLLRYDGSETRPTEIDGETGEYTWWKLTPKLDVSKGPLGKWNSDEKIEVLDPKLDESQIEAVTQQLGEILSAEL